MDRFRPLFDRNRYRGRFHALGRYREVDGSGFGSRLNDSSRRAAEQIHLRLVERAQARGIAVGRGAEPTAARYLEMHLAANLLVHLLAPVVGAALDKV